MKSGIYIIVNMANGKVYTGSSKDLWARWRRHRSSLLRGCHRNIHLQSAWDRHGESVFLFEVVEYCGEEDLLRRETWWIDLLGCMRRDRGYNIAYADRSQMSLETRRRISDFHRGKPKSPEQIAKQSATMTGRLVPTEVREKISASKLGQKRAPFSREHREKIALHARTRTFSPMTREKIGRANAKPYSIIAPDGTVHTGTNVERFCRDHGLDGSSIRKVIRGLYPHYKGWRSPPRTPSS